MIKVGDNKMMNKKERKRFIKNITTNLERIMV